MSPSIGDGMNLTAVPHLPPKKINKLCKEIYIIYQDCELF